MSKTKSIVVTILSSILILVVDFFTFVSFPIPNSVKNYNSILSTVGRGIDISGGYYVVLTPKNTSSDKSDNVVNDAMNILRTRLDKKGYTEAVISVQDGNKIRVEIPQVDDADEVLSVIGQTGELTFEDKAGKIWLNGEEHIKGAYVATNRENGEYVVVLQFNAKGQSKFAEATKAVLGSSDSDKKIYIKLGGETVSSPTVNETINSSTAQITGYKNYEDAQSIAAVIDSGRLPISYEVSESRSISSKIGDDTINKSAIAGAIGLGVILFCLL